MKEVSGATLLLALYRNPDSLAARLLTELSLDQAAARAQVSEMLKGYRS